VIDTSPPFAGTVFDGPEFKVDWQLTKDKNQVHIDVYGGLAVQQ
jgi:hypothetical protein